MWLSWVKDLNAGDLVVKMFNSLGGKRLCLVVIDEVSMLPFGFLVLLDGRLRAKFDPLKPFGGISVLLVGDFLQLPTTVNKQDLYCMLYSTHAETSDGAKAKALHFRALPARYPTGMSWSADDFDCLAPRRWLNSQIVTFFIQMYVSRCPDDIFLFNTFLYTSYLAGKMPVQRAYVAALQRHLWIIPIHEAAHWILLLIANAASPAGTTVFVLDSLARSNGRSDNA
ncbi:unnamed protein product [Lampetra fluviatilis]